jgi:hypothetical protein
LPDPRVNISQEDYNAQLALSKKVSSYMEDTARSCQAVLALHAEFDARKKAIPANPPKELADALLEVEKEFHALEDGNAEAPGFGILNRDFGHDLVMIQSADVKPAESAYSVVNSGCNSITKNILAWNKLNVETLPALNKLLKDQKVDAIPAAAAAPAPAGCSK